MREQLLSPSLSDTPARAIGLYSPRSSFLLAFFGGPMALVLYSALNSARLKRPLDAIAYIAATLGVAALVYAAQTGAMPDAVKWISQQIGGAGSMRGLSRLYALLLWTCFYLMHRKQHRSVTMFGEAPSPWKAAIACFALGVGITFALSYLMAALGGA